MIKPRPDGLKLCSKCKVPKDPEEFYEDLRASDRKSSWCKPCCRKYRSTWNRYHSDEMKKRAVAWCKANREKARSHFKKWHIKKKFGLTVEEYDVLTKKPCSICGVKPKRKKRHHMDHCHKSGKVRGPLCQQCNHGLGSFKDNPDLLRKAIAYLKRHS